MNGYPRFGWVDILRFQQLATSSKPMPMISSPCFTAPESSHAIKAAIDEALKCKETGEEKTIVFGLTGTGYFDMVAYEKFHDGKMEDYIPTDDELKKSIDALPKV